MIQISCIKSVFYHCRNNLWRLTPPNVAISGQRTWMRLFASSTDADAVYSQYLQTKQDLRQLQDQLKEKKSSAMYEAWKQSEDRAKNPQTTGVAVVRTLVKETRKEDAALDKLKQKTQRLLKEAALEHQHPRALVELGNITLEQEQDPRRALDYYEKSNNVEGRYNAASILWSGYVNSKGETLVEPDRNGAMDAFRKAIAMGDADAMYFVGVESMDTRAKEGLSLIENSADAGHPGALYYVALLHLNGDERLGISPCSSEDFLLLLNKAIDVESADALFLRGHAFFQGDYGLNVDYAKALQDFLRAADLGHADAAVSAGAILHRGYPGVKQSQEHAFSLYQSAGELGSIEGWRNVVSCYLTGEGVPQSEELASYIANTMLKDE